MPDTATSPGRPAVSRDYPRPPSDQGDIDPRQAAADAAARPAGNGGARAERGEPRWRDIQWVDFTSDSESGDLPKPTAEPEPKHDATAIASMLRRFAETAPGTSRDAIPGLASRFARLSVPRLGTQPAPIARAVTQEPPPSPPGIAQLAANPPAPAVVLHPRVPEPAPPPPPIAALQPEPEPPPVETPPLPTPQAHTAWTEDDEKFPAALSTPVTSEPPAQPAPALGAALVTQLVRAGAVLRRQRASVASAFDTGIVRARGALRARRPLPEPSPIADGEPAFAAPPTEPVVETIAPSTEPAVETVARSPEPSPAGPSVVATLATKFAILATNIETAALRLAGNDRKRLRTWLTLAAIVIAAYLVGAYIAGLAVTGPSTPRVASDQPAQSAQATPPAPQPQPQPEQAQPPQPATPPSDPAARAAFYLARAKEGDPTAQYDVGVLYARGDGLVQDFASAASWFHAAAAQGNIDAEFNLGVLYERGLGVPQNATEAINWYRSAADRNHAGAQYNLALAYAEGRGANQDFAAAARWYQRAAQQRLVPAMINLAILYEGGKGVDRSPIEAYAWYSTAAERGDSGAKDRAAELFRQLSEQDKARAQGLAATIAAAVNGAPPAPKV